VSDAAATVDTALGRLEDLLGRLSDGDLHLASPGGGWTVAQVVSHISVSTLVRTRPGSKTPKAAATTDPSGSPSAEALPQA
jgi:hypothetical protein